MKPDGKPEGKAALQGDTQKPDGSASSQDPAEPGFDASLRELEAIVALLDQETLGLESSLLKYREGVALVKKCQKILASFQRQVEELSAEDGTTRPYPGDPDVRAPAG